MGCLGQCQTVSDFEFTDYAGTYEILIPTKLKLPPIEVDSAGDNVYVLAFVVM